MARSNAVMARAPFVGLPQNDVGEAEPVSRRLDTAHDGGPPPSDQLAGAPGELAQIPRPQLDAILAIAWRVACSRGLRDADADDVAQRVAIAASRQWGAFNASRTPLERWVFGLVRVEVLRFSRAQARLAHGDRRWLDTYGAREPATGCLHLEPTTADRADDGDDVMARIREAVEVLPDETDRLLVLLHASRFTFREIEALLGMPKSTACKAHAAAVKKLTALLRPKPRARVPLPLAVTLAALETAEPPSSLLQLALATVAALLVAAALDLGVRPTPARTSKAPRSISGTRRPASSGVGVADRAPVPPAPLPARSRGCA